MKLLKTWIVLLILAALLAPSALAAPSPDSPVTYEAGTGALVSLQNVGDAYALFLPASADLTKLTLRFEGGPVTATAGQRHLLITSGQPFDLTVLYPTAPADGVYFLRLSLDSGELPVKVMASQNIASMYITSADPVQKGRAYVEQIKGNAASGQVTFLSADGSVVYAGELSQIKGRGNSTWSYPKKPYQIKLGKRADLLESGDPDNVQKTWILLANYLDTSLIRNSLSYDLAAELGIAYTPDTRPIDLYYDGEYRGTYLLSEKVQVSPGRVDIHDLEGDFEAANPWITDFDALATAEGRNAYGAPFQYVTGLNSPYNLSGGYLLEIDYPGRAAAEKSYFTTTHGYNLVSKSPEYLSRSAMAYISAFYQEFEDAVFHGGVNPNTGKSYTDYVDLESLAKCYLILELSQDGDAFYSSTFFYKPAGEEKLYAGPVWDFDSAYGLHYAGYSNTELVAGRTVLGWELLSIPSFCQALNEVYQNELAPLVTDVALNQDPGAQSGRLRSIAGYRQELAASSRMNDLLWPTNSAFSPAVDSLQHFLSVRGQYLQSVRWETATRTLLRFQDVPANAWYYSAVDYVTEQGLFSGTDARHFSPDDAMTRAMAVTVLYRLAGEPAAPETAPFPDGAREQWYAPAVAWAADAGMIHGSSDGLFHPDESITRQEFAALLYHYTEYMGLPVTAPEISAAYSDWASVAPWATDALSWAVDRGIISGTSSTTLSPDDYTLRYMVSVMFQRYDRTVAAGG